MSYYRPRRYYRRRRPYYKRRRRFYKKKSSSGGYFNMAKKALNVAYGVKKLLNVEYKDVTVSQIGGAGSTVDNETGVVYYLPQIEQGDGGHQRDGDSVKVTSLNLKCKCTINASANATKLKFWLVNDLTNNGTEPTLAMLLETPSVYDEHAFRNRELTNRLKVIKCWTTYLDNDGGETKD